MEYSDLPIIFVNGVKAKNTFFHTSIFRLHHTSEFLHRHDVLELGVCLEGEGEYITVGDPVQFVKGDVQVIMPSHPHYNIGGTGGSLWAFIDIDVPRIGSAHISTDPAYFLRLVRNTGVSGIYTEENSPTVVSLVRSIAALALSERATESPTADLIAAKVSALLLELTVLGDVAEADVSDKRTQSILPAIHLATDAVEKGRDISPYDMAAACFMSESYFRKIFSSVMGEPPKNYILRLQMQRAAALLVTTELSVSRIARLCGDADNSTFYRRFVRAYGVSPREYRENVGVPNPVF